MAVQSTKKSSALAGPAFLPMGHHAGKPPISLAKMVILVGSRHNAHLHLLSRHVSKAHALILSYGGSVYIRDLASREGVYINGVPQRDAWLGEGDLVKVGTFTFKYKNGPTVGAGAEDDAAPHDAVLEIEGAEAPLAIAEKVMLIGRRATCDISLIEASVSTAHAVIFHVGGKRYIRDLGSRTGTFVNGAKIHQAELSVGDSVRIGETEMRYALAAAHEHAIGPADEVDELEHLIGTAPLDMAAEMHAHPQTAPAEFAADLGGALPSRQSRTQGEEDLIELEVEPFPTPPQPVRSVSSTPVPLAPIPLEPEAQDAEIDLSTDPDVADLPTIPTAGDTQSLPPVEVDAPRPTISKELDDELMELELDHEAPEPAEHAEAPLLDVDLVPEIPVESAAPAVFEPFDLAPAEPVAEVEVVHEATAEVAGEIAPPEAAASHADTIEAHLDALWPEDLIPLDETDPDAANLGAAAADEVPISPRGGWQRMPHQQDPLAVVAAEHPKEEPPTIEETTSAHEEPEPLEVEEEVAAVEELAPIAQATPEDEPAAIEELAPIEEAAVVEELPAHEELAPVEELAPIEELAPLEEELAPLEEPAAVEETEPPQELPAVEELAAAEEPAAIEAEAAPAELAPVEELAAEDAALVADAGNDEVTAAGEVAAIEAAAAAEQPLSVEEFAPLEELPPLEFAGPEAESSHEEPEPIEEVAEAEVAMLPEPDFTAGQPVEPSSTADAETLIEALAPLDVVAPLEDASTSTEQIPAPSIQEETAAEQLPPLEAAAEVEEVPPVETAEPLEEPAPVEELQPLEDLAPVEEQAEIEQAATAEAPAETELPAPVEELAPLEDLAPAEEQAEIGQAAPGEELVETEPLATVEELAPLEEHLPVEEQAEIEQAAVVEEALATESPAPVEEAESIEELPAIEAEVAAGEPAAVEAGAEVEEVLPVEELESLEELPPLEEAAAEVEELAPVEELEPLAELPPLEQDAAAVEAPAPVEELEPLEELPSLEEAGAEEVEEVEAIAEAESEAELPAEAGLPEESELQFDDEAPEEEAVDVDEALPLLELDAGDFSPASTTRDPDALLPLEDVDPDELDEIQEVAEADENEPLEELQPVEEVEELEEVAELEPVDEVEEVIESTEPTPDSAFDLNAVTDIPAAPTGGNTSLSDSMFGRQVQEFTATTSGDIVEEVEALEHLEPAQSAEEELAIALDQAAHSQGSGPAQPHAEPADLEEHLESVNTLPAAPVQSGNESETPGDGGFSLGADLSSFIGGMPLVLPDLPPAPVGFGQVPVRFSSPRTPIAGPTLAHEVMSAAQGLRDVEDMDEADAQEEAAQAEPDAITDEGAPGDEWNVAGLLDDEEAPPLAEWSTTQPGPAQLTAQFDSSAIPEELLAEETEETEAQPLDEDELLHELQDEAVTAGEPEQQTEEIAEEAFAAEPVVEAAASDALAAELEAPESIETPTDEEELAEAEIAEEPNPLDGVLDEAIESEPASQAASTIEAESNDGAADEVALEDSALDEEEPLDSAAVQATPTEPAPAAPKSPRARKISTDLSSVDPLGEDPMLGAAKAGAGIGAPFAGMGGVREVDVFSQSTPAPVAVGQSVDPFSGLPLAVGATAAAAALNPAGRQQRVIVPPRMGVLGAGMAVAEAEGGVATYAGDAPRAVYRPIPRKRRAGKLVLILVLMLISMAAVSYGIWHFWPPKLSSTGELHFQNMTALTKLQRDKFAAEQEVKLTSQPVQLGARGHLAAKAVAVEPGFLSSPEQLGKVKVDWPESRPGVMQVSFTGNDPKDGDRIYALLMALYSENHTEVDRGIRLKSEIANLNKELKKSDDEKAERDAVKRRIDAAIGPEQIQKLEAKAREAENQYDVAMAAAKDAQLEVRRAQEQLPSAGGEAVKGPVAEDKNLLALQKQLEEAAAQAATAKSAASEEADARRKQLDQAIELFQQAAAGAVKESPQLARYVQSVQQLQEQTHKLSGDLIEVQQQQHKRLSALKKDLDDQVQARRTELWATDKELVDLRAQLDLAQRGYNAAVDQKLDENDIKAELAKIRNLTGKIDLRKLALGNDPIVTKVGQSLQEMISITKERLEADRQRIEKDIKEQERAFAQSGIIEKLPETQQKQAAALKAKQEAINDLRKQYAEALDKRTADSNAALRASESQIASITAQIDERKRLLADQNAKNLTQQQEAERRATLEKKQAALRDAETKAAAVQKVYLETSKAVADAKSKQVDLAADRVKLESLDQNLAAAEETARVNALTLDKLKGEFSRLVTAEKPSEHEIKILSGRDDRGLYIAGSVMGLALLFGLIAVFAIAGGDKRAHFEEHLEEAFPAIDYPTGAIEPIDTPRPGVRSPLNRPAT